MEMKEIIHWKAAEWTKEDQGRKEFEEGERRDKFVTEESEKMINRLS